MVLAVCANNIGVVWVAIEATTVVTAFLVGHRRTRTALEATWKYVIICSVGIAIAFLGTVLLYFAAQHAGAPGAQALDLDVLAAHAGGLDPGVTRLAGGLLLIGYGAKAGLVPVPHLAGRRAQPGARAGLRADERGAAVGGVLGAAPDQADHRRRRRRRRSCAPGCW